MEKQHLLYLITGTESPRFVSEREMCVVDICLKLINDREEEISDLKELNNIKSKSISTLEETLKTKDFLNQLNLNKIQHLEDLLA